MQSLPLNKILIEQRIRAKFGTKSAFEQRTGINRATLTRWYKGTSYPRPESFLTLAGAIDLDFMALIDISAERLTALLPDLMRVARIGNWKDFLPTLAFLDDFLFSTNDWPSCNILRNYDARGNKRHWCLCQHEHLPVRNEPGYYAGLVIQPSVNPQVWYFGFKEAGSDARASWFPYGCVRALDSELTLLNFIGESQSALRPDWDRPIVVETLFSGQPTEFRVASLHPFDMQIAHPSPAGLATVRFRYPGPSPQ